jgi:hypothetical protein
MILRNHCRTFRGHRWPILLQRDGERYRALVDVTSPALDRLKSLGADQIAATPVTLEDMFIGLTQG